MTDFITLTKELVDSIAETINGIDDFDPIIIKHTRKTPEIKKGKYSINIMPVSIEPDEVSSRSSYPIINIDIHVYYFALKEEELESEYTKYLTNLNKI